MEWHRGIISKVTRYEPKPDEKKVRKISYYEGTETGYHNNDILISIKKDGAVTFNDDKIDGGYIYLYPEQVKLLKRILNAKS